MADKELLVGYRKIVEKRLAERIDRHAKVDPSVNLARLVDRQIAEELVRLKRMLDKEESPVQAEAIEELIDWVQKFGKKLKAGRYKSN